MRRRFVLAASVILFWIVAGLVSAAQSFVGATLQNQPASFGTYLRPALIGSVSWIPLTFCAILLVERWPVSLRRLPLHLLAAIALTFVAQMIVVVAYGFTTVAALISGALLWVGIRLMAGIVVYGMVAAVTQATLYYRDARTREVQLAQARLQALNAQIRPHFLFNTLHTIGQLWRSGRNDKAEVVLDRLGELFHRVNQTTNESEVPLSDEIDMVRDYLGIEQVRFQDRLRVDIDADDSLDDYLVPPLILQPIVENAVRHGDPTTIHVSATLNNGTLLLVVDDDGKGYKQNEPGTGLSNTRERLKQLYGVRASLDINGERGTRVTIRIPAHEH